jgi:dipeptidyl aminopeptidase/acylaminoacyl peptidase
VLVGETEGGEMRTRFRYLIGAVVIAVVSTHLPGQASDVNYLTPPADVAAAIDASMRPQPVVSPSGKLMALVTLRSIPSIDTLAQPMLRLAGRRINPQTNSEHFSYRSPAVAKLVLKELPSGIERPVSLPAQGEFQWSRFSPNGAAIALTQASPAGMSLWIVDTASGKMRQLTPPVLNGTWGEPCRWLDDSGSLLCRTVPRGRSAEPVAARVPTGPRVQEHDGKPAPLWTSQDLLASAHDEALFDHYFTSRLAFVSAASGAVSPFGEPGLFAEMAVSPSGQYIAVGRVKRPYSRIVGANGFARDVEILDRKGSRVRLVSTLDLAETVPINGVRTGARTWSWNPARPASFVWVEALDGGDPSAKVAHRDRVLKLDAPFSGEPFEWARTEYRFQSIQFTEQGLAFVSENDRPRRWTRTWFLDGDAKPRLLFDRAMEDRYADPGRFVPRHKPAAPGDPALGDFGPVDELVVLQSGRTVYLAGDGGSPEGDRPFLDRLNLDSFKRERLFRSSGERYEAVLAVVGHDGPTVLTQRETRTSPPNVVLHDFGAGTERQLTAFTDAAPALSGSEKRLLTYERKDGVKLSATLYVPGSRKPSERLPLIVWAYPREFTSTLTASQVVGSPNRYDTIGFANLYLALLLRGYAVMVPTMPIVGSGETANDTYVEQLVASAEAAVDAAVSGGVADRHRVGVAGHSYGAFMTANLLAHSDIFRTGIALSGAYNRSLTPFGFQNERRTFWEVPELYARMSPFWYSHKLNEPILLMHGEIDNNQGTFPIQSERLYLALKGHGARVRYVTLPYESHRYAARETLLHVAAEFLNWFDRYVRQATPSVTSATGR